MKLSFLRSEIGKSISMEGHINKPWVMVILRFGKLTAVGNAKWSSEDQAAVADAKSRIEKLEKIKKDASDLWWDADTEEMEQVINQAWDKTIDQLIDTKDIVSKLDWNQNKGIELALTRALRHLRDQIEGKAKVTTTIYEV